MDLLSTTLNDKDLRVVAYLLVACLAFAAAWQKTRQSGAREGLAPAFWASAGVLFVILAFSREASVGSHIAAVGRAMFRGEGWYSDRRPLQKVVIFTVLAAGGVAALGGAALLSVRGHRQLAFGFVTMMALGVFLVVRAISWHDIDGVLYRQSIDRVQVNAIAELTATALAGLAAAIATVCPLPRSGSSSRGRPATRHI